IGFRCKHAVAVILDYLDALKNRRPVPLVDDDDRRWQKIEGVGEEPKWDEDERSDDEWDEDESGEEDDAEEWGEESEEEEPEPEPEPLPTPPARAKKRAKKRGKADVRGYLEDLPAPQLVEYILDLAQRYEEVKDELSHRALMAQGDFPELVRRARQEIRDVTS